jgi:peptidoglycan/LPS O-acetylase OafA/YrhL
LRALAAMLVVIYHVWLERISGGVDVFFFFILGFLTTLSPILEQGMTTALGW